MKRNKKNLILIIVLVTMNVLFYVTGGFSAAKEASMFFAIAMSALVLLPLVGIIYITKQEWIK